MEIDDEFIDDKRDETMIIPLINEDNVNKQTSNQEDSDKDKVEKKKRDNNEKSNKNNLNTNFSSETLNKIKEKVNMMEDKQVNYNEKFFDYKSFDKNKKNENLKRKSDMTYEVKAEKRTKNDWVNKREFSNKVDNYGKEMFININSTNPKADNHKSVDIIDLSNKSPKNTNIQNNNHKSKPQEQQDEPALVQSILNSDKKIDLPPSPLSLAFDSNINSKDKNIENNFSALGNEAGKQSTKFQELLKLKKEKGISIGNKNRISEERENEDINERIIENSGLMDTHKNNKVPIQNDKKDYDLDLHTLEDTYNDFYEIKPKIKRNPFLPNDLKNRDYKNSNLQNRSSITNVNINIKNKKEREKMNGYKCEICQKV